ncbi:Fasciclin-like arabinogalactan protein 7 [Vitis vinifera]|uniref:Fasciclin-like arabinogalactan protein 7 n=1 Tax=Vitis vinifera TaxID=29760 RepID=A0A438KKS8_VITVI|nr:Fasciclin-like arabinogalactan protein 7 [Vitis vinifera]
MVQSGPSNWLMYFRKKRKGNKLQVAGNIGSGWTNTKVSSSVHSTDPVAVYQVDKVLLPEAIFGTDIPPTPAPAPAPDISPDADAPTALDETGSPRASSTPSSSYRIIGLGVWSQLVLAISGGLVLFL